MVKSSFSMLILTHRQVWSLIEWEDRIIRKGGTTKVPSEQSERGFFGPFGGLLGLSVLNRRTGSHY